MVKNQLYSIAKQIRKLMGQEDRKDIEFRINIALSELGDVAKYVTHDPKLNPNARPHGSPEDEKLAYGQLFVQLFACAGLRGIDIEKAIYLALENWKKHDWKKAKARESEKNTIKGILACPGTVTADAFLDPDCKNLNDFDGQILVTKYATPDIVNYFKKAAGVVTDHGGKTSHAANIAREYNIPCIVGTGDATERIPHGRLIKIEGSLGHDYGLVYLL